MNAEDRKSIADQKNIERAREAKETICTMCNDLRKELDRRSQFFQFDLLTAKQLRELAQSLKGAKDRVEVLLNLISKYIQEIGDITSS